jgi:hypothetical protein
MSTPFSRATLLNALVLLLIAAIVAASVYVLWSGANAFGGLRDVWGECIQRAAHAPDVDLLITDRAVASDATSYFPLGVNCEWRDETGAVLLTLPENDWTGTIRVGIGVAVALLASTVLVILLRRPK